MSTPTTDTKKGRVLPGLPTIKEIVRRVGVSLRSLLSHDSSITRKVEIFPDHLPDKLSDLILIALVDVEEAEKAKGIKVDMEVWHSIESETRKCRACFAGCAIRGMGVPDDLEINAQDFREPIHGKMRALDMARKGNLQTAQSFLGERYLPLHLQHVSVVVYHKDPKGFKDRMRAVANQLKKEGF